MYAVCIIYFRGKYKKKVILIISVIILAASVILAGCTGDDETDIIRTISDLNEKTPGNLIPGVCFFIIFYMSASLPLSAKRLLEAKYRWYRSLYQSSTYHRNRLRKASGIS